MSTAHNVELVQRAIRAGATRIEATSFVHPKHGPQMADAEDVMAAMPRGGGVRYGGLVVNRRGLDRALAAQVDENTERVGLAQQLAGEDAKLHLHLHDTRHTGVANAVAAVAAGVVVLDASIGGAGGCPFAPNATGNIATEDLVYLFDRSGIETGMDLAELIAAAEWLEERLGKTLPGALLRAGAFPGDLSESGGLHLADG